MTHSQHPECSERLWARFGKCLIATAACVCMLQVHITVHAISSRLSEYVNVDVRHFDLSWLPGWINNCRPFAIVFNEAGRHQVADRSESSALLLLHTSLSAQSRRRSVDCTRAATRGPGGSILCCSWINFHGAITGTTRGLSVASAKEKRLN